MMKENKILSLPGRMLSAVGEAIASSRAYRRCF